MEYFKSVTTKENLTLSCDMLRISFRFDNFQLTKFNNFINDLSVKNNMYDFKIFQSLSYYNYRYMINFKYNDYSFVVGLFLNSTKKEDNKSCFIEFNPNKCLINGYVNPILDYIKFYGKSLKIVRFDFAIDIKCRRYLVSLSKDLRDYNKIYKFEQKSVSLDDVTEYLGHHNNNGFVKLYNKQKESNLNYNLTRLEITLDSYDYENFLKYLPKVYYIKNASLFDCLSLNDTDRVILSLLLQNDNPMLYIKMLGRGKQDKFKKILFNMNSIVQINENDFYSVIRNIRQIIA